nr:ABC transporter substrate-binding protein [uncultured Devosia sp.]
MGVVAPLTGQRKRQGLGIVTSLEKYLTWETGKALTGQRRPVELVIEDDRSEPSLVADAVRRCLSAGALAIVGPSDSACAGVIANHPDFAKVPFILSFATRTALLGPHQNELFRVTTPDFRRVMILLRFIQQTVSGRDLTVFSLDDHPDSYASGLLDDLTKAAADLDFHLNHVTFSIGQVDIPMDTGRHPVVICAPSHESTWLIEQLRSRRLPSPIYSFGSNRNYLRHSAVGTTLVCDIKYDDYNPIVQQYLQEILGKDDAGEEVSLSSVLAMHVISQAVAALEQSHMQTIAESRAALSKILSVAEFQGPFGLVAFSKNREMIGHENISLVTVRRRGFTVYFGAPETLKVWGLHARLKWQARLWEAIIIVSTIGGAVGLLQLAVQALG